MINICDNSNCDLEEKDRKNLFPYANKSIEELESENPNLIVFPPKNKRYNDKIQKSIFKINGNKLQTANVMGFLGIADTKLKIYSRFSKFSKNDDYFLYYMLSKILSFNITDLKFSSGDENILDFLCFLFPFYFTQALNSGIYKEYQENHYNDHRFKSGCINSNKQLKNTLPFNFKIAYSKYEIQIDNPLNRLIRQCLEFLKNKTIGKQILSLAKIKKHVDFIMQNTTFNRGERKKIIDQNSRKLKHQYYYKYIPLQKLCIKILKSKYLNFKNNTDNDKIYGLLFDGAWLWEEYLFTILKDINFIHSQNKIKNGGVAIFTNAKNICYPDFYKKDNIVLDAKYKYGKGIDSNDLKQIITYIHILNCKFGGFIYPSKHETKYEKVGELNGYGGSVFKYFLKVPKEAKSFNAFCEAIKIEEKNLLTLF